MIELVNTGNDVLMYSDFSDGTLRKSLALPVVYQYKILFYEAIQKHLQIKPSAKAKIYSNKEFIGYVIEITHNMPGGKEENNSWEQKGIGILSIKEKCHKRDIWTVVC